MVLLIPLNGAVAVKMRAFQVGASNCAAPAWSLGQVPGGKQSLLTWALPTTLLTEYGRLQATFTNLSLF